MTPAPVTATRSSYALGTTATVLVTEPAAVDRAHDLLKDWLDAVDRACSRFRPDSDLTRLNAAGGAATRVGPVLGAALAAALRAASATDGLVDPTVGASVAALGYDRTFTLVPPDAAAPVTPVRPPADWRSVRWDEATREACLPDGVALDLGATGKAFAADHGAAELADALGCGVLVNLGGDIAVAGPPPAAGWQVALAEDHRAAGVGAPVVTVERGGLATSGTAVRVWRRAGRPVHHIVDPATGACADPVWRTVTVAAATCVAANAAATAAVVLGERAPGFLTARRLPARLVRPDGTVLALGGWPRDTHPGRSGR